MLVLTRKPEQSIRVGDILIHVLRLGTKNVSIGIDAPADVEIVRTEVLQRQKAEGRRQKQKASREAEVAA